MSAVQRDRVKYTPQCLSIW